MRSPSNFAIYATEDREERCPDDEPAACVTAMERPALKPKESPMNTISVVAVSIALLVSSAVVAQPNYSDAARGGNGHREIETQNRNREDAKGRGTHDQDHGDNQLGRGEDRRDDQGANRYQSEGQNEVRDTPHWSRGDRLSGAYRDNTHEVSDWRGRHLRQPPRGYHWVQANNQYVLAAVATGVIAEIVLSTEANRTTR
jgi:Ni/Co efflux regulator RcnB